MQPNYQLATPPISDDFAKLTKDQLWAYAKWFHEVMPARLQMLKDVVTSTPGFESWPADFKPASLADLGRWCLGTAASRKRSAQEMAELGRQSPFQIEHSQAELTDETISIALDTGMYLGEVVIKSIPGTHWGQDMSSRRSIDYGHPVVMGFDKECLNPVRMCTTMSYGMLSGHRGANDLCEIYEIWQGKRRRRVSIR